MTQPIDTAFVAIEPDASGFAREAERDVGRVISTIEREFEGLVNSLERSFKSMASDLSDSFREVASASDRHFDEVASDADEAARAIASDIERGTEAAERSLGELGRHAKTEFNKVSREAGNARTSLISKLGGAGGLVAAGVGGAAVAITAGLGAIATFGLQAAAEMEQSRIQFQSLIGSVEKGNKVFADLQKFAAETPFEFPDIASASARFLAFNQAVGLSDKDLQGFLTTIGNVASVTGGGAQALQSVSVAMGQMASSGKLTLDNLNQISEAMPGFSGVAAIASAQGKTTAQVMDEISKGTINAEDGIKALLKGMQKFPGAAGAMEKQSQTLAGVLSTLKDTVGQALAQAFEPALPAIKKAIGDISPLLGNALGDFVPAISDAIIKVLPVVSNLIQGLSPIISVFSEIIGAVGGGLGPALESLGNVVGVLLKPMVPLFKIIGQVASVLGQALLPIADALAPVIEALAIPLVDLITALLPIIPPLAQILALVIQIITPILKLTTVFISMLATKALVPIVELLAKGLAYLLEPLGKLAEFMSGLDWGDIGNAIMSGLKIAGAAIADFFVGIWDWLQKVPAAIGNFLSSLPGMFVDAIIFMGNAALHALGMVIGLLIYEFIHFPEQALSALSALGGLLVTFFTWLWSTVTELARTGFTNLVAFVKSVPGMVLNALVSLPGVISRIWTTVFTNVRSIVTNGWNWVISQITSIPGRIASLASRFLTAGKNLIQGFITGFKSTGSFIGDVAGSIVGTIKGFLNNVIGKLNSGIADIDSYLPGSLPRIPYLASGGIAYGPALIGEKPGGKGEAAIPLDDARAISALRNALGGGDGGTGVVFEAGAITVVFNGVVPSAAEARRTGEAVAQGLGNTLAANGTRTLVRSI